MEYEEVPTPVSGGNASQQPSISGQVSQTAMQNANAKTSSGMSDIDKDYEYKSKDVLHDPYKNIRCSIGNFFLV